MKRIDLAAQPGQQPLQGFRLIFALVLVALVSLTHPVRATADHPVLALGAQAPNFSLKGVDGKLYSLTNFSKSKVLMVVFTCNHCPTAQAYEDTLKRMATQYQAKGVAIVAISSNDSKSIRLDEMGYSDVSDTYADMKIRAKDKKFNFPYLYDGETSATALKYGPQATPHIFIFDKARKLRYTGRIDDGMGGMRATTTLDARNALDQLVADQPVTVEKTKTFGCSIKWPEKNNLVQTEEEGWAKEKVTLAEIGLDSLSKVLANKSDNFRLINFWATWCGPCVSEFSEFVAINHMYRLREFELVTVSMDEPARQTSVLNFLTKKQASAKNYLLTGDKYKLINELDKNWEGSLPYTLLVAPGGKVIYSKQGPINPLALKQIILSAMGRDWKITKAPARRSN